MSPSNRENLLKVPSLADAEVAGAVSAAEPDAQVDIVEVEPSAEELAIARELVGSARARGVAMTGPCGMLKALTKTVIETALDEEMTDHSSVNLFGRRSSGSGRWCVLGSGRRFDCALQQF